LFQFGKYYPQPCYIVPTQLDKINIETKIKRGHQGRVFYCTLFEQCPDLDSRFLRELCEILSDLCGQKALALEIRTLPVICTTDSPIKIMKSPGLRIRPAKARGEWAELRFLTRAIEQGFRPTKPWGENAPYDFAVEHNGHFSRVQVKCTCKKRLNSYVCSVSNSQGPYSADQIDFIAAYIIPTDTWYIFPQAVLNGSFDVWLTPQRKNSKYAEFKEAWHLLKR
jgi:hypothetical protein